MDIETVSKHDPVVCGCCREPVDHVATFDPAPGYQTGRSGRKRTVAMKRPLSTIVFVDGIKRRRTTRE